jgi:transcriptional regulator with XRE-family HTH domain
LDRDSIEARATIQPMKTNEIEARAKKRGMTIAELLKAAGVNRVTWWRWKSGRFQPRAGTIERIIEILDPAAR